LNILSSSIKILLSKGIIDNIEKRILKGQNTYQVMKYKAFLIYHLKTKKARELPIPVGRKREKLELLVP